eukprot:355279-Chlamydomonas_euryale.AAC.4
MQGRKRPISAAALPHPRNPSAVGPHAIGRNSTMAAALAYLQSGQRLSTARGAASRTRQKLQLPRCTVGRRRCRPPHPLARHGGCARAQAGAGLAGTDSETQGRQSAAVLPPRSQLRLRSVRTCEMPWGRPRHAALRRRRRRAAGLSAAGVRARVPAQRFAAGVACGARARGGARRDFAERAARTPSCTNTEPWSTRPQTGRLRSPLPAAGPTRSRCCLT